MTYYLSKPNTAYIQPYIDLLLTSQKDESFDVKNPKRFAYILRNAFHVLAPDLRNKYMIKEKETKVLLQLKNPEAAVGIAKLAGPTYTEINLPQTLYQIATKVITEKPKIGLRFTNPILQAEDLEALNNLLKPTDYSMEYESDTNILIIKREDK